MPVNIMIIGAQKSATTTLFDILKKSPKLTASSNKEPDFFTKNNWKEKIDKYHSLFLEDDCKLKFEASTQYTFKPHIENKNIVNDIYNYNPEMKFIYVIRNPVDRIISAYMHAYQMGLVSGVIDDVVHENDYFIDVTRYAEQIKPYIDVFGREQVLILDFNDVVRNLDTTIQEIEKFLGFNLEVSNELNEIHSNRSLNTIKFKEQFIPMLSLLQKISNHFPAFIQNTGKKVIYLLPFLHGPKLSSKPVLSDDTLSYLKKELGSQKIKMEAIMGRSLNHWDNL